jgi:RND family efflux transporter MFP subunit
VYRIEDNLYALRKPVRRLVCASLAVVSLLFSHAIADPFSEDYLIGVLFSRQEVLLRAETAERVKTVGVELGQHVARGTVIAQLDDRAMALRARAASTEIQSSLAEVAAAASDSTLAWQRLAARSRTPTMWSKEEMARSQYEYDQAVARKAAADSKGVLARTAVETAKLGLIATRIRAPFSGMIAAKYVSEGQQVSIGDPIARLIGDGAVWVRFAVPTPIADSAKPSTRVKVLLSSDASDYIEGVVRYLSPEIDPASGMRIAEAELFIPTRLERAALSGLAVRVFI